MKINMLNNLLPIESLVFDSLDRLYSSAVCSFSSYTRIFKNSVGNSCYSCLFGPGKLPNKRFVNYLLYICAVLKGLQFALGKSKGPSNNIFFLEHCQKLNFRELFIIKFPSLPFKHFIRNMAHLFGRRRKVLKKGEMKVKGKLINSYCDLSVVFMVATISVF